MIDFSQVTAITIPEGSVSKITDSSSNILWQAGTNLGRYVLVGAVQHPTSSFASTFTIYDTVDGTRLWQGQLNTEYITGSQGNWSVGYNFIIAAIQNVTNQIGININNIKVTHLYISGPLDVTMYGNNTRYLKATNYNNNTLFETTARGTSVWGATGIEIPWNDSNIISNYWSNEGIEDISCINQNATTLTSYYTNIRGYTTGAYTTQSSDFRKLDYIGYTVFFE